MGKFENGVGWGGVGWGGGGGGGGGGGVGGGVGGGGGYLRSTFIHIQQYHDEDWDKYQLWIYRTSCKQYWLNDTINSLRPNDAYMRR